MQEIQFIAPAALHDEMLRLRNDKQMDFLESLTGMDWGVADEKDTPEKLRGLGVVYHLESTITGERIAFGTTISNSFVVVLSLNLKYTPSAALKAKFSAGNFS